MKHTKGEWKILGQSDNHYISVGIEGTEEHSPKQICKVNWGEGDFENACLITSAPDLLAACEVVLEVHPTKNSHEVYVSTVKEILQSAINKAKGGE